MTEKLVVIGNGMAPGRMLEHLLEKAPDRYQVTIFNAEPRTNYDRILLSPRDVGELEREYVLRATKSGWVAPAGPDLDAFEREVAGRVGVPYAVGLSSGNAALDLALVSWGVGRGDVVAVSTFASAAPVNAIPYVGAEPHSLTVKW